MTSAVDIAWSRFIPHAPEVPQHAFLWLWQKEALYGGAAGGGKLLDLQTPISTPSGWTTMGDLEPGDFVFGADGRPTRVVACSAMEYEACFELTFDTGETIVAGARHLWKTMSSAERMNVHRRTPEYREKRNSGRASKTKGNKSKAFTTAVAAANRARIAEHLEPSTGTIRETWEIAQETPENGRRGHSIENAKPLRAAHASLPVDPYVLGCWLGDGSSSGGKIHIYEDGIFDQLTAVGEKLTRYVGGWNGWCYRQHSTVAGLTPKLKALGLINNKHIPMQYLRASGRQRLALLQGLMDTDGSCNNNGQCSISSSYPALAEGIQELLYSLGLKSQGHINKATLYGVRKKDRCRFKFVAPYPVFRLARKREKQKLSDFRGTASRRYIVSCKRTEDVPLRCIQVEADDGMFLCGRGMVPTHNSDALLMGALQYVDVPGYAALILRRTYADLSLPGAIMDRSHQWLQNTDARWNDKTKTWTFPSGATLTFGYLQSGLDKYRYQSAEFQYIAFDELTQIPLMDYTYMFSRLRKPSMGPLSLVPLRMRSASNPGGRYYQWVTERFPVIPGDTPAMKGGRIFIPAKLGDNPHVDQESYRESLAELTPEEQAQLLLGDWTIRAPGPWAFRHRDLDAAFALGAQFDLMRLHGTMPEPVGSQLFFGCDYGEHSHVLIGWPLEGRGWYIAQEIVSERGLPDEDLAPQAVVAAAELGFTVARARYDASKPESQRIFYRKTKELTGSDLYAKPSKIAFSKYKRAAILHTRRLLSRSARGLPLGVLAVSSAGCPLFKSQMYALQHKPGDTEDIVKEEDHGPDAGFALIAPDSKKQGLGGARMGEEGVA